MEKIEEISLREVVFTNGNTVDSLKLFYYPLANEVAKGYSNATVRPSVRPSFRNILVNTLGSTSFNGF